MSRIPEATVEQIKARADILGVVSEVVRLKQRGRNYFGLCPFHNEKTPSFSVNPSMGIFHCFGCGKGGNAVTFVMEYDKVDYVEALTRLADKFGIRIEPDVVSDEQKGDIALLYEVHEVARDFYHKQLFEATNKDALDYLHKRNFGDALLKQFTVGFAPAGWDNLVRRIDRNRYSAAVLEKSGLFIKREDGGFYDRFRNRIMFPIHNLSGRIIAFGGRTLDPNESAKYLNSPESPVYFKSGVLYGLHLAKDAIRKTEEAIVVEGYTDFLRFYSQGFQNVVAGSGTALTPHHAKLLKRFSSRALLCYDGDEAGQKAMERAGFIMMKEGLDVRAVVLPEKDDPDSYLSAHPAEDFRQLQESAPEFIPLYIENHRSEIQTHATRTIFVERLVEEIADIQHPVTRDLIIREIAELLHVNETAIRSQLRSFLKKRPDRLRRSEDQDKGEKILEIRTAIDRAEFELLKILLCHEPDLQKLILEKVSAQNFRHPVLQRIVTKFFELLQAQKQLDPASLFDLEWSEDERFYLSRLILEAEPYVVGSNQVDLVQLLSDCLVIMLTGESEQNIQKSRDAIRAVEKSGADPSAHVMDMLKWQKRRKEIEAEIREKIAGAKTS